MGFFIEKSKLSVLVNGNGLAENFKENSIELAEAYSKSSKDIKNIPIKNIIPGGFYHLQSVNDSNWMRNAPVFVAEQKRFRDKIILMGVNLNFIPLEIRVMFFDKFIDEKTFEKDDYLKVNFQGVYNELRSLGFEYALMEFDVSKIIFAHKISMNALSSFLISQHPTNKYDPKKIFEIWKAKIGKSAERDAEIQKANLEDFYNINKEISGKYDLLQNHIKRLRRNL